MENQILRVSLLGGLRFDYGENHVDDTSGHSKKIWLLLAYLVTDFDKDVWGSDYDNGFRGTVNFTYAF